MHPGNLLIRYFSLTLFLLVATLYGCGVAHVRTETESSDLHHYDKVYISEVKVYSLEDAAKTNVELQAKMDEWRSFARAELETYVNDSHYQLINKPPEDSEKALVANLDINLTYGNRAIRYFVGFGAGKGSVNSVLTVADSHTGEEKFRGVAESDLAMGAFGGDMQAILKDNIKQLIDQYPRATNADR